MKALLSTLCTVAALACAPAMADTTTASSEPCPQLSAQLADLLALPYKRIGTDGAVRVEFEVDAQGRAQVQTLEGERQYRSAVRAAMRRVDCTAGTPHLYAVDIVFSEKPSRSFAGAPRIIVAQATRR
ncbi:MAG TPA: hypothetical protein VGE36_10615 [Roseateles sp.]